MRLTMSIRLIVIALLFAALPLAGQEARGTLLGRVTDPSEAVLVGAVVRTINAETGVRYATTTNSSGDYLIPFLIPGRYAITVEHPGFKTHTRAGIALRESERVTIDVAMQVGDTSQSVQVVGEPAILYTSTASMGQVIESRAIADLPSKDGMVLLLATLSPGVTFTPQSAAYVRPFDTSSPSTMSIDGTRNGSNEFMVDGASNMQGQQIAYLPPQSVVGEFKVQTATFDAAYGCGA